MYGTNENSWYSCYSLSNHRRAETTMIICLSSLNSALVLTLSLVNIRKHFFLSEWVWHCHNNDSDCASVRAILFSVIYALKTVGCDLSLPAIHTDIYWMLYGNIDSLSLNGFHTCSTVVVAYTLAVTLWCPGWLHFLWKCGQSNVISRSLCHRYWCYLQASSFPFESETRNHRCSCCIVFL